MSYFSWRVIHLPFDQNIISKEDILTKEIESWKGFEYALLEENRLLFHEVLRECTKKEYEVLRECTKKEYADSVNTKGENFSAESLFLILILHQHKMINELIAKLRDKKW